MVNWASKPTVVLAHGWFSSSTRTPLVMIAEDKVLKRHFLFRFVDYKSHVPPGDYVGKMQSQVKKQLPKSMWAYVGHSMGGIIGNRLKIRNLVTINSPGVQGSGIDLKNNDIYNKLFNPGGDIIFDDETHTVTDDNVRVVRKILLALKRGQDIRELEAQYHG